MHPAVLLSFYFPTRMYPWIYDSVCVYICVCTRLGLLLGQGLDNDPEEELAVLDQLIEWQRQTGEYGVAAK